MYSRILFAVADDEVLDAAVPVVAAFARRWAAAVRVLHVQRVDPDAPNEGSRRLVTSVVERLTSAGIRAEGEIRLVHRGEAVSAVIAGAATRAEADLVAIGSHGRSDLGALFLGSVSHAVAAGLETPVLLLRAGPEVAAEPRTVLVAVGGSAGSDETAVEAAEVAASFGARGVVVHVRQVVAVQDYASAESEEEGRAIVDRAVATMREHGVEATGETPLASSVVHGVVDAARILGADLVVLGSRRPSHLGGLVLGSVAHEVVHQLRCPVLLAQLARRAEAVG